MQYSFKSIYPSLVLVNSEKSVFSSFNQTVLPSFMILQNRFEVKLAKTLVENKLAIVEITSHIALKKADRRTILLTALLHNFRHNTPL